MGKRNEHGQKLIDFAKQNRYVICNTLFNHHRRRRYTWKMPGDVNRYQLDYILIKERFRNAVKNCRAYPGVDINSDHNLLAMDVCVTFKKIKKGSTKKRWNIDKIKGEKGMDYTKQVEEKIDCINQRDAEQTWQHIKNTIIDSAKENLGYTTKKPPKNLGLHQR